LSIAIETNEKSSEEVGWLPATMPEMTDPVTGGPSKDPRHWRQNHRRNCKKKMRKRKKKSVKKKREKSKQIKKPFNVL